MDSGNKVGTEGSTALAEMLKCNGIEAPKLLVLSLAQVPLNRECLAALMPAVARSVYLKELNLSNAKIEFDGCESVASMIKLNDVRYRAPGDP